MPYLSGSQEIPCQAGFSPSNPLLVRPIPRAVFEQRKPGVQTAVFGLYHGSYSGINQFGINEFACSTLNSIHTVCPFRRIGCFECFSDVFDCRHLFSKLSEHFIGSVVNLTQMCIQFSGHEQIVVKAAQVLMKMAPMALTIDADWAQF